MSFIPASLENIPLPLSVHLHDGEYVPGEPALSALLAWFAWVPSIQAVSLTTLANYASVTWEYDDAQPTPVVPNVLKFTWQSIQHSNRPAALARSYALVDQGNDQVRIDLTFPDATFITAFQQYAYAWEALTTAQETGALLDIASVYWFLSWDNLVLPSISISRDPMRKIRRDLIG